MKSNATQSKNTHTHAYARRGKNKTRIYLVFILPFYDAFLRSLTSRKEIDVPLSLGFFFSDVFSLSLSVFSSLSPFSYYWHALDSWQTRTCFCSKMIEGISVDNDCLDSSHVAIHWSPSRQERHRRKPPGNFQILINWQSVCSMNILSGSILSPARFFFSLHFYSFSRWRRRTVSVNNGTWSVNIVQSIDG